MPRRSGSRRRSSRKCKPCKPCRRPHVPRPPVETFDDDLRALVAGDCHSSKRYVCQTKPYCSWRKRSSRSKRGRCTVGKGHQAVDAGRVAYLRSPPSVPAEFRRQRVQVPKVQQRIQGPRLGLGNA